MIPVGENPRSEVGRKLGVYGDDSGDPVKMFFSVSFFVATQGRKLH